MVAKNGSKENIQWAEDGLKPVSKRGAVTLKVTELLLLFLSS